ncbi:MAG: ribosomal protein S18-alanine N-acetyltransferase [Oscillospiraceae bacterium]|jgi:ribosomal-protein-alanine N-acetyltransferase|nr:ribosomal protein S18-alanine N-acetyltransferase [Oscillospiraceae bacterium]
MDFNIEPMRREHIPALAGLEKLCFSEPWSEKAIASQLSNKDAKVFVAQNGGLPLAYAGMYSALDEGYISNVCTHPLFRGKGIASALMAVLIDYSRAKGLDFLSLEVRVSNRDAISLYKKYGFLVIGRRKSFYAKPTEDAYIMTFYL